MLTQVLRTYTHIHPSESAQQCLLHTYALIKNGRKQRQKQDKHTNKRNRDKRMGGERELKTQLKQQNNGIFSTKYQHTQSSKSSLKHRPQFKGKQRGVYKMFGDRCTGTGQDECFFGNPRSHPVRHANRTGLWSKHGQGALSRHEADTQKKTKNFF